MSDRCPQCDAEFGPDDAYCPRCGTPRRGVAARPLASEANPEATWPNQQTAATVRTGPDEHDDFIPLVIPADSRKSWQAGNGRRPLFFMLIGLALVAALGVGAWFVFGGDDDDDGADALDRPDVPAWVVGGSPTGATPAATGSAIATPDSRGVADDNIETSAEKPTAALPSIGPGSMGSASTPATTGPLTDVASSGTMAPSPTSSPVASPQQPTATVVATITPSPTASPSPTATPSPTIASTPAIPASVFPNTVAGVLTSVVADLELPSTDANPTPTPSAPASVPPGDGTGGLIPQTPPA